MSCAFFRGTATNFSALACGQHACTEPASRRTGPAGGRIAVQPAGLQVRFVPGRDRTYGASGDVHEVFAGDSLGTFFKAFSRFPALRPLILQAACRAWHIVEI